MKHLMWSSTETTKCSSLLIDPGMEELMLIEIMDSVSINLTLDHYEATPEAKHSFAQLESKDYYEEA